MASTLFRDIERSPWNAPDEMSWAPKVRTMLNPEEQRMLRWLAREHYTGRGAIIDAGCFLGGSTVSLAQGLRESGRPAKIDSFDLFVADEYGATHFGGDFGEGESFRFVFDQQTEIYSDLLRVHAGDIRHSQWIPEPIEILFIDLAKTKEINDYLITTMFPQLIPHHSVVIQQDYLYYYLPWIHIIMERLSDHFELLCDTTYNSVVFGCVKAVTPQDAAAALWGAMTATERVFLMDQAIERWTDEKRQYLVGAKGSFDLSMP